MLHSTGSIVDCQWECLKLFAKIDRFLHNNNRRSKSLISYAKPGPLQSKALFLAGSLLESAERRLSCAPESSKEKASGSTTDHADRSGYLTTFTEAFGDDLEALRRGEQSLDQEQVSLLLECLKQSGDVYYCGL